LVQLNSKSNKKLHLERMPKEEFVQVLKSGGRNCGGGDLSLEGEKQWPKSYWKKKNYKFNGFSFKGKKGKSREKLFAQCALDLEEGGGVKSRGG